MGPFPRVYVTDELANSPAVIIRLFLLSDLPPPPPPPPPQYRCRHSSLLLVCRNIDVTSQTSSSSWCLSGQGTCLGATISSAELAGIAPLHSTPLHSTPLHSTPLYSTLPYPTLPCPTLLYSTWRQLAAGIKSGVSPEAPGPRLIILFSGQFKDERERSEFATFSSQAQTHHAKHYSFGRQLVIWLITSSTFNRVIGSFPRFR